MKKYALFLACLAALAFSACGEKRAPAEKGARIGVSLPSSREARWARDLEQLRKEAASMGAELFAEVADNNAAQQLAQCEALLKQNISVLILAPHDAEAAGAIARAAKAAGVKVIAYDRLVRGEPLDLYVSFDNFKVGVLQARALAALAPRGNYLLLSGAPTDANAALYRAGALSVLKPLADRGDIKIVADRPVKDWLPAEAQLLAEEALTALQGNIQAVLAPNDATAGAVIRALEAGGLAGRVPVTGQDAQPEAARRILAGLQAMTVFKDTRQQAAAAFGAAMNLAAGGTAPAAASVDNGWGQVPALLLDPVAVDRGNIGKALVDSGYLKQEEVYGRQQGAR